MQIQNDNNGIYTAVFRYRAIYTCRSYPTAMFQMSTCVRSWDFQPHTDSGNRRKSFPEDPEQAGRFSTIKNTPYSNFGHQLPAKYEMNLANHQPYTLMMVTSLYDRNILELDVKTKHFKKNTHTQNNKQTNKKPNKQNKTKTKTNKQNKTKHKKYK